MGYLADLLAKGNDPRTGLSTLSPEEQALQDRIRGAGGIVPPNESNKPSLLERVGRVANFVTAAEAGAVRGILDPNKNVFQGIQEGIQKNIGFKDVLQQDLKWNPTDVPGKVALNVAGFGLDVLLDPITYLSFGAPKGIALATKEGEKVLSVAGKTKLTDLIAQGINPDLAKRFLGKQALEDTSLVAKSGIRFAGKLLPGSENIAPAIKALPIVQKISDSPLGEFVSSTTKNFKALFDRDAALRDLPVGKSGISAVELSQANRNAAHYAQGMNVDTITGLQKKFGINNKTAQEYFWARAKDMYEKSAYKGDPALEAVFSQKKYLKELPSNVQQFDKVVRSYFDSILSHDQQYGLVGDGVNDYITQIWKNPEKLGAIQNVLLDKSINQSSRFGNERVFSDVIEGMKFGLKPEDNILKLMYARKMSSDIATLNQKFVADVMKEWADVKVLNKMTDAVDFPSLKLGDDLIEVSNIRGLTKTKETQSVIDQLQQKGIQQANQTALPESLIAKNTEKIATKQSEIEKELSDLTARYDAMVKANPESVISRDAQMMSEAAAKKQDALSKMKDKIEAIKLDLEMTRPDKSIKVVIPRSIASELLVTKRKLIDDKAVNGLLRAVDTLQNFFKGSVTTLFPAFHGRNAISNVILSSMDIAGQALNPETYARAIKIAKGGEGELVTKIGTKYSYKQLKQFAKESDLIGGQIARDVFGNQPFTPGIFKAGKKVGSAIEENARLAHFAALIERGFSPDQAAQRVKQFLFDYDNLSEFEKTVMKRIFPFYTWTRKNLELHFKMLAQNPGYIASEFKLAKNVQTDTAEQRAKLSYLPEYLKQGFVVGGKDLSQGKTGVFSGFGTPVENFVQTLTMKGIVNLLSPYIKKPIEQITGTSLFTEKPRGEDDAGYFARNFPKPVKDFLQYKATDKKTKDGRTWTEYTVDPAKKRMLYSSITGRLTSTVSKMLDNNIPVPLRIIDLLSGVRYRVVNIPGEQSKIEKDRIRQLEDTLQRLGVGYRFDKFVIPKNQQQ